MKQENKTIVVTSIIAGVVLIVALAFLLVFQPKAGNTTNSITVQGISSIKATPDLLSVYFNIETKAETSAEATSANAKILENFTNALIAQGFEKEDIKTENFNVYPNTYWENDRMKDDGYKATHSLIIQLEKEEFDKVSEVIDAGVEAGAGVSYINFELTQESQNTYKAQALKLAATDAKIKAESIAEGFDKKVGSLISVSVNDFGYYPWNVYSTSARGYAEDAAMAKEVAMNIQPTEQEISASISAVYKMR
jgi:uncharacterized protein YggE